MTPLIATFAGDSARGTGMFSTRTVVSPTGSHVYTSGNVGSGNTFTWTAPAGVTSVSVVAVGSGGANGASSTFYGSYFISTSICYATSASGATAGSFQSGTSGNSGGGGSTSYGGGGGASGYTSAGGAGGTGGGSNASGGAGGTSTDGGGGGGGSGYKSGSLKVHQAYFGGGAGGSGVGLYGANVGYSGAGGGGSNYTGTPIAGGSGSSSGGNGAPYSASGGAGSLDLYSHGTPGVGGINSSTFTTFSGVPYGSVFGGGGGGGAFGGGAGGVNGSGTTLGNAGGGLSYLNNYSVTPGNTYTVSVSGPCAAQGTVPGQGGGGGVRIVWPGATRQFPSTSVSTTTNEVVN